MALPRFLLCCSLLLWRELAGPLAIRPHHVSKNFGAVDFFLLQQRVAFLMPAAENDAIAFGQAFAFRVSGELALAFLAIKYIRKNTVESM